MRLFPDTAIGVVLPEWNWPEPSIACQHMIKHGIWQTFEKIEDQEELMDRGRKMRLNDAIQIVLETFSVLDPISNTRRDSSEMDSGSGS